MDSQKTVDKMEHSAGGRRPQMDPNLIKENKSTFVNENYDTVNSYGL